MADRNGKPVPSEIMLFSGNRSPVSGRSAEDGKFTCEHVPPGNYVADAFDDGSSVEYGEPEWMRVNAGPGLPVTITPRGTLRVALERVTVPK
ncbi:MAG: hypothetical protein ABUS49_03390 [Acidobacteriota bacterium]